VLIASAVHEAGHAVVAEILGVPVVDVEILDADGSGFGGSVDLDFYWSPGKQRRESPAPSLASLAVTPITYRSNAERGVYDHLANQVLAMVPPILAAGRLATFAYLSTTDALLGAVNDLKGERIALAILKARGIGVGDHERAADAIVRANYAALDDLAHELIVRGSLTGCEVRTILHEHGIRTTDHLVAPAQSA
jgi:hypothetical protein